MILYKKKTYKFIFESLFIFNTCHYKKINDAYYLYILFICVTLHLKTVFSFAGSTFLASER